MPADLELLFEVDPGGGGDALGVGWAVDLLTPGASRLRLHWRADAAAVGPCPPPSALLNQVAPPPEP